MAGFIDNNLDNIVLLLEEIIKFVNSKDLTDEDKEIYNYVKDLYRQLKSKEVDILKYDFKLLRRRVNKLIHPDINPTNKAKAVELSTRVNTNIDDILKFQKSMAQNGSKSYNWKYQTGEERYEFKPSFKEEKPAKDKYKTYYSGDLNKEEENLQIYGYQTVGDSIREFWNYIFNKVPRDINDYHKFKASYQKIIAKLKEKIENKTELLKNYELKIKELNLELKKELKVENINEIFEGEKKSLNSRHNQIIDEYEDETKKLAEIRKPLEPTIDKAVREKCDLMRQIYDDYREIRRIVEYNPSFIKKNYPGTKMTYSDLIKYYESELNKYPNAKILYEKISNEICMQNRDYVNETKKIKELENKAYEVYNRMMPYFENPERVKGEIREEIQDDYERQINEVERKKKLTEKKKEKLMLKQEHVEAEYAKFLVEYESKYEPTKKKGGRR